MKKVGIITLNDNNNYGNRLQNLASQYILENLGFEAETIINRTVDRENRNLKYYIKIFSIKKMNEYIKNFIIRKIINKKKKNYNIIKKREENFKNFNKKINFSKFVINEFKELEELEKQYDFFIVGSDQVWNPYLQHIKEVNFLMFSPKEKNIAYAASFGVDKIPTEMQEKYKTGLNNLHAISVREEKGQEIVKTISNKKATLTLDPTMLLTSEKWLEFSNKPQYNPTKQYMLTCFLGETSKKRKAFLRNIAKENNLEIIELNQIKEEKYYEIGPSEFIYMIKNAALIFTDSFHVCVFSILFERSFYVLEREGININMNSRIDTLLNKFKLEDRRITNLENSIDINCNYSNVGAILKEERRKSIEFLKQSLKIKEQNEIE